MAFAECKLQTLHRLKMGVAADNRFVRRYPDEDAAREDIKKMFREVSEPFIEQFNIEIIPAKIVFGEGVPEGAEATSETLHAFSRWRGTRPDKFGGWFGVISSRRSGTVGFAWKGVIGLEKTYEASSGPFTAAGIGQFGKWVIAHEIGHMFSMGHINATEGIMTSHVQWNNPHFSFLPGDHQSGVCNEIRTALRNDWRRQRNLVPYEEMWDDTPVETTPTRTSSTPTTTIASPSTTSVWPTRSPTTPSSANTPEITTTPSTAVTVNSVFTRPLTRWPGGGGVDVRSRLQGTINAELLVGYTITAVVVVTLALCVHTGVRAVRNWWRPKTERKPRRLHGPMDDSIP